MPKKFAHPTSNPYPETEMTDSVGGNFLNLINPINSIGPQYSKNTEQMYPPPPAPVPTANYALGQMRPFGDVTSAAGLVGVRPLKGR